MPAYQTVKCPACGNITIHVDLVSGGIKCKSQGCHFMVMGLFTSQQIHDVLRALETIQ